MLTDGRDEIEGALQQTSFIDPSTCVPRTLNISGPTISDASRHFPS